MAREIKRGWDGWQTTVLVVRRVVGGGTLPPGRWGRSLSPSPRSSGHAPGVLPLTWPDEPALLLRPDVAGLVRRPPVRVVG